MSFHIFFFFFFLVPKINSKGHKTFLRKEAVVVKLLEAIWIWIRVLPQEVPALLALLLLNVSLQSFVPLCRISCCQVNLLSLPLKSHSSSLVLSHGFCPYGLEKFDWIGKAMFENILLSPNSPFLP